MLEFFLGFHSEIIFLLIFLIKYFSLHLSKIFLLQVDSDVIMVMRTSLSMKEFASALGMKASDVFVKKMFAIVDKDNDNRISFQEFLDMIVLFSKGRTDDKLQIIFDMCDSDKNGTVDKEELSELLNSLIDIAKTKRLSDEEVGELINSMFKSAGFNDKNSLNYDDFKTMMKEFKVRYFCLLDVFQCIIFN